MQKSEFSDLQAMHLLPGSIFLSSASIRGSHPEAIDLLWATSQCSWHTGGRGRDKVYGGERKRQRQRQRDRQRHRERGRRKTQRDSRESLRQQKTLTCISKAISKNSFFVLGFGPLLFLQTFQQLAPYQSYVTPEYVHV